MRDERSLYRGEDWVCALRLRDLAYQRYTSRGAAEDDRIPWTTRSGRTVKGGKSAFALCPLESLLQ